MNAAVPESQRGAAYAGRGRLRSHARQLDRAMTDGRIPALLVVVVSGLLLYAFLLTDDFQVETVTVSGVAYGDTQEVVDASNLLERSAFDVDIERTAARIAALPYVERVSIELNYPGQAAISIQERPPEIVVSEDGRMSLVSASGIIIAEGDVEGLPRLEIQDAEWQNDEPLPADLVAAVRSVAGVYGPLSDLVWDDSFGLAMEWTDGRSIIFGNPEEIEEKLTVLAAIEDQIDQEWTHLDLRVPTRPAYR